MTPETANSLGGALRGLAIGRVVLGIASLAAPNTLAKVLGVDSTPALAYMTRIFGARAIALGLGYLTSAESERFRWQRLALMVDITDTVHGAAHLVRGDLPRASAAAMVALTGSYMSVGAARLAKDLGSHPPESGTDWQCHDGATLAASQS